MVNIKNVRNLSYFTFTWTHPGQSISLTLWYVQSLCLCHQNILTHNSIDICILPITSAWFITLNSTSFFKNFMSLYDFILQKKTTREIIWHTCFTYDEHMLNFSLTTHTYNSICKELHITISDLYFVRNIHKITKGFIC